MSVDLLPAYLLYPDGSGYVLPLDRGWSKEFARRVEDEASTWAAYRWALKHGDVERIETSETVGGFRAVRWRELPK